MNDNLVITESIRYPRSTLVSNIIIQRSTNWLDPLELSEKRSKEPRHDRFCNVLPPKNMEQINKVLPGCQAKSFVMLTGGRHRTTSLIEFWVEVIENDWRGNKIFFPVLLFSECNISTGLMLFRHRFFLLLKK